MDLILKIYVVMAVITLLYNVVSLIVYYESRIKHSIAVEWAALAGVIGSLLWPILIYVMIRRRKWEVY